MMRLNFLLSLLSALLIAANENFAQRCASNEISDVYLDAAMDILKKVKDRYSAVQLQDCSDILSSGSNKSGIYKIWPQNRVLDGKSIDVYCDMQTDGGGWTVIQRRGNFERPVDYFYKDWKSYKEGFGDLDKDFWLGNDNIFAISNQKMYSARFDLKDIDGDKKYAKYDFFWIDDEFHKYMLHIKDYIGNAGDSMYPKHNEQMFSTKDQKNDHRNSTEGCAFAFKGAWWYNACHDSNLNGLYLNGKHESHANGVNWKSWKGHKESLEETEIKIRPKHFHGVNIESATLAIATPQP